MSHVLQDAVTQEKNKRMCPPYSSSSKNERSKFIRECPIFGGLAEEGIQKIASIASTKRFGPGELIFTEGSSAEGFYVVVSGKVKVYKLSLEGKEQILHMLSSCDALAEAALCADTAYPAYAESVTESELLYFPRDDFLSLVKRNPQLGLNLVANMCHLLRQFVSMIEGLSLREVSARVAKYLMDLAVKQGVQGEDGAKVRLDITKTQLASNLGTISETLSRTLRKLRSEGVVEVKGNLITILDCKALRQVSAGMKL